MTSGSKKHKILIVDDVAANIRVLVKALGEEYRLSIATSAQDALKMAVSQTPPDLILLDTMMPDMDGYEVLRRLKSERRSAQIPVVFVTSMSQETDEERGLELGAADYITRPFRLPIVKARIKNQLARKRAIEAELGLERLGAIADLASGVAHHFNNMLQVIMGGASLALIHLKDGELGGAKSMLHRIMESSRLGSETVKSLEDFVRMQTEKIGPARVFDLSKTTHLAIANAEKWGSIRRAELEGRINLIPELKQGCFVVGKENELFKVIVNLVRNAVEAMPQGGELRIRTSANEDQVLLRIADTGMGIPEEYRGKIFEPFFTTKGYQRVGMGLPSSYGIVRDHGGTISVESRQGQGTAFVVQLPLGAEICAGDGPKSIPRTGLKLRILIIDDVEPIVKMLSELLAEFGHEVLCALSGEQGLDVFEAQPIDLVICDLELPGLDGWEVANRMKKICDTKGMPKVFFMLLTGWAEQLDEKTRMVESGVDAIVAKPVDPSRLLEMIGDFVKSQGPTTEP